MVYGGGLENRLSDELSWVRIPPPPPVGKRGCWLAFYEGSAANFRRKIEFFVFVLRSKPPEAGFSLFYFPCLILNIEENIKNTEKTRFAAGRFC